MKDLVKCLTNSEFVSATRYLDGVQNETVGNTVRALARTFGDSGCLGGDMTVIVEAAVAWVIDQLPEEHQT